MFRQTRLFRLPRLWCRRCFNGGRNICSAKPAGRFAGSVTGDRASMEGGTYVPPNSTPRRGTN